MRSFFYRLGVLAVAFLLCALLIRLAGQNPAQAASALLRGALGTPRGAAESLAMATPLLMTGLAVAVAFRAGFFNIGAEGQFLVGALAATALGTKAQLAWPLVLMGGAAAGAAWAAVAAWLKLRRGAPEIITTIMLNYVAIQLVVFVLQLPAQPGAKGGWLLKSAGNQPESDVLPARAQLPALMENTNLHAGLFLALFCAVTCWWFLFRTEGGFLARAAGANPVAARGAGIKTDRHVFWTTALSGALAGLGGAMEIAGATKQLTLNPPGYGYTAIAVALLGATNPLGAIPAALLFGVLGAGGSAMERNANVPAVTVSIIVGTLVCAASLLSKRENEH